MPSTAGTLQTEALGLVPGTWVIDPAHSEIAFTIRHLMSKVRGAFTEFEGSLTIGATQAESSATAQIQIGSIDTRNSQRDEHIRSAEILDLASHPTMRFVSKGVRVDGDRYLLDGELTVRQVTRPVTLEVEFNGVGTDPWGGTRAGFSATTTINRKDFGVEFNIPLQGDRALLSDKLDVTIEVQAALQA